MTPAGARPPTRLLLVTQLAPPSPLVAARRAAGLTKYLARCGVEVTVVTSSVSGDGPIEGAARVVRTSDLLTSRLNWRRAHFTAFTGDARATYSGRSRLESVVVPDLAAVSWLPFALPAALKTARRQAVDCVLTSSPPQSAHVVGVALRRRGVPWIADLRDGWTFEPQRDEWPAAAQRSLDARLERSVLRRADAVVGVTEPIVADARRRLGVRAELVTNGFDPEDEPTMEEVERAGELLDRTRHSLVHTGRMAAARSTPVPLLDALRRLRAEAPGEAARLEVVFAGPLTDHERTLLEAPDLDGLVRWVGALDRRGALALQRAADSLLVVTEGPTRTSVATGKLFEYLAAARPILVLGTGTEAARIVTVTATGTAVPHADPGEIAQALRGLLADAPFAPRRDLVEASAYPALAARLAALVDEVVTA